METMNTVPPTSAPVDPMDKLSPVPQSGTAPVTPPSPATSSIPPTTPPSPILEPATQPKKRSKGPLIILLSLFVVLLLMIGAGAFLALVAYGKVDLGDKELERKISFAIQDLPYTPKTPHYLIYKGFDANKNTQSFYLDASVAVSAGDNVAQIPGLGNKFDLVVEGPVDYHDKKNPEVDINVKLTPDLDADLVVVNKKLFFKINKIPAVIQSMAEGSGYPLDLFMEKWIWYELSELESEARNTLDQDKETRDAEKIERLKLAILNSSILDKIVLEDTDLEGTPVYKMTLEMTNEEYMDFLNDVARAVDPESYGDNFVAETEAQTFEDLKITTYVEKGSMHTRRSMISFRLNADVNVPSQVLGASTIQYFPNVYAQAVSPESNYVDVAAVIDTTRFNEDFEITEPQGAMPIEALVEQYMERMRIMEESSGFEEDSSGFATPNEDDASGIMPY